MKFPSVSLKGNILTFDTLEEIADGKAGKSDFRSYDYDSRGALQTAITDAWADANSQYGIFRNKLSRLSDSDTGVTETRASWIVPLFASLGYTLGYNKRQLTIDERSYAISHAEDSLGGFPVHVVGANQSLDKRGDRMSASPHALVQEYLNRDEAHLYAIVTNGRFLRLLRDSSQLTRLSYVEFDLTRVFEEELVGDFALLFRLLHRSRLPQDEDSATDSHLEKYHQEGLASGSRIRDGLSKAVEHGILQLGTGLLHDPANAALRTWAGQTPDAATHYYDHLLKLIYRLLFIMVIEERDLIFPGGDAGASEFGEGHVSTRHRNIYYQNYSLSRLRQLSLRRQLANARAYDLWENLLNTFHLFEPHGVGQRLGIEPLAGDLFRADALGPLADCRISNAVLLGTLNGLSEFDNGQGRMITVNYASLDVEEFGSVYEGLLEYKPVINENPWRFDFVEGDDRGSSGSHYTPDELVQPLIKHSLEHLIAGRTVAPDAPEPARREAIWELLSLTVCDVACGSGHILLAAARRIGLEVARLRSTEEQPNPAAVRKGTREAIRHCIYGVDKNPLAVELCKVALWLEAHVPGEPLNFLDHRIKNGDAIVGLGRMEELQNGIATEAFKAYRAEEKVNVSSLKKRNKQERKVREAETKQGIKATELFAELDPVADRLDRYRDRFARFSAMPERTVEEIEAKQAAYRKAVDNPDWYFIRGLADLQVAQFFVDKVELDRTMTDAQYFDFMYGRLKQSRAEAVARGVSAERRFFHWFLEFPEVFWEGGFSCILGNPPFLGGRKISSRYGSEYLTYLAKDYSPIKGQSDLAAYFFRRINYNLKDNGFQSLIATNTIAQGDTREGGILYLTEKGSVIIHAIKSVKWPGLAAVNVSLVTLYKGEWDSRFVLNNSIVENINSHLDDQKYIGEPFQLKANRSKSFKGTMIYGNGFVVDKGIERHIIQETGDKSNIVFPYLSGADINSVPDQGASRLVLNFFDWPERRYTLDEWEKINAKDKKNILDRIDHDKVIEIAPPNYKKEVAADYSVAFSHIEENVKPDRENNNRDSRRIFWWQYGERTPALYEAISGLDKVLVVTKNTKYPIHIFTAPSIIFTQDLTVFDYSSYDVAAIFNSTIAIEWFWKNSGTLGAATIRLNTSSCYENFPLLLQNEFSTRLDHIGQLHLQTVSILTVDLGLGLTKLYNQFHNPHLTTDYDTYFEDGTLTLKPAELKKQSKETYNLYRHLEKTEGTISLSEAVERIAELRKLHKEMDEAVLAAYGWHVKTRRWGDAIRLRHDFYEVDYLPENDRVRYTIHPDARREVLKRLLLLNHEIHEAETRKNPDGTVGVDYSVIDGEKVVALMREQVEAWLPGGTEQLHPKTLKFLCSGEDLLPNLDKSLTKSYKPFVTQYASALENELLEKIFVAFDRAFQSRYPLEDDSREEYLDAQRDVDPKKLGNFTRKLLREGTKYTLGEMQFLLSLVYKPTGSTISASTLLQDFRAFVQSVYGELLFDRELLDRLKAFTDTYRNVAAHTGEVDKGLAVGCRDEVRGVVKLLVDIT